MLRANRCDCRIAYRHIATEAAGQMEGKMKCAQMLRMFLLAAIGTAVSMSVAQEAKVRIKVYPPEAQIFVDAKTWGKGPAKEIKTTPGTHMVIVANYGFVSQTREL